MVAVTRSSPRFDSRAQRSSITADVRRLHDPADPLVVHLHEGRHVDRTQPCGRGAALAHPPDDSRVLEYLASGLRNAVDDGGRGSGRREQTDPAFDAVTVYLFGDGWKVWAIVVALRRGDRDRADLAAMSTTPPGVLGTIIVIGLAGQDSPRARVQGRAAAKPSIARLVTFIRLLPLPL